MRSIEEIQAEIKAIESDERMSYPDANIFVNAPLALHQVSQKAKLNILKWVLEEELE